MKKGTFHALAACFFWSFIYVVPYFITSFSSIEVALGRYFIYGLVSGLIFLKARAKGSFRFSKNVWIKSLYFSLICTIGYYTFLVIALRYCSSPALCVLIVGASPVTIAIYGNWKKTETEFKKLIFPSVLILLGLLVLNYSSLEVKEDPSSYYLGLVFSVLALLSWTWYVEANSRFLKQHPHVSSEDWCTLIGIATLFWVVLLSIVIFVFFNDQLHLDKYLVFNQELAYFVTSSVFLGIFGSWVAEYYWNLASLSLHPSVAGQLTIFETFFALLLVYAATSSMPVGLEMIGIVIQTVGVYLGIRLFREKGGVESKNLTL